MAILENGYKIRHQRGSVLVEAVIALPVFFFILFGIVEYGYAYRARATLNLATFDAVRAGTLNNARLGAINSALATGMTPQYMKGRTGLMSFQAARVSTIAFLTAINNIGGLPDSVNIVAPTSSTFTEFRENINVRLAGSSSASTRAIIPNDNLYWRSPNTESVNINGTTREVSIQDANILKIKTLWCHRLVTPGLDRMVYYAILNPPGFVTVSDEQQVCNRLTLAAGLVGSNNYYVAITSQSVMRMQSPVFSEGQLP